MRLEPVIGDDPRDILRALKSALHGAGPALGLGLVSTLPGEVRAGTAVVVTTSGSTGVPEERRAQPRRPHRERAGDRGPDRRGRVAARAARRATSRACRCSCGRSSPTASRRSSAARSRRRRSPRPRCMMVSTDRGVRVPTFTSLVPAQLTKLLDAAEHDTRGARRAALVRDDPRRRPGAAAGHARARRDRGRAHRPHLRLDRDERRLRLRRRAARGRVGAHRRRRGAGRRARRSPTATSATRRRRMPSSGATPTARGGIAPATPGIIEDGVLRVRGRIDNVIVSGGVNVSLDRVERVVRGIPGLESAVVVGVPDARWGEASVVVVAARRGAAPQRVRAARGGARRRLAEIGPHARPVAARARRRARDAADRQARPRGDPLARSPRCTDRRISRRAFMRPGLHDAEPVALGVFEHDPVGVVGVAVPVHLAGAEPERAARSRRAWSSAYRSRWMRGG